MRTRDEIEKTAPALGDERWDIWMQCCVHKWQTLPRTESGEHYCPNCCTIWTADGRSIDYRHYLPELARKPQAARQVLPDLLRDLGAPFPAVWDQLQTAHSPREAARHFAKVLGQLDAHGPAVVVPAIEDALITGTPLLLALAAPAPLRIAAETLPPSLRDLDVRSGCAADYDT